MICKTSSSPALGKSDHVVKSIKAAQESLFHRTLYNYDKGDWDSSLDFLRDVPWPDVFMLVCETCGAEVGCFLD